MKSDHSVLNRVYNELKNEYGEKAESILEFKNHYAITFPINDDGYIKVDKKTGNINNVYVDVFDFNEPFYWENPDFIRRIDVKEIDP